MKFYYFYSKFGYNDTVREGKIYKFTSNETLKYVLEINIDLIAVSTKLYIYLRPYLKKYLDAKRNIKFINFKYLMKSDEKVNICQIYI